MNPGTHITPLDPQNLTANASLNRVRIIDLPGVSLEDEVKGSRANELLSAPALAAAINESAEALEISNTATKDHIRLPLLLNNCFESSNPQVRDAAEKIAHTYGRRLGYLIATLKRGDPVNREARPEWDDTYWRHWAVIRQIKLGGGLVAGHLGAHAVKYALDTLEEAGVTDCAVTLAEYPSILPLLGAARIAPLNAKEMLIFDFGNSFTKRARASYQDGILTAVRILPGQQGEWITCPEGTGPDEWAHNLAGYMIRTMSETWQETSGSNPDLAQQIAVIVASYILNGRPDPRQIGPYGNLRRVSLDTSTWFSRALSTRIAQPVSITLLHDGTAAAKIYAGTDAQCTAVITLGTFLGVGFPPSDEEMRPIGRALTVS